MLHVARPTFSAVFGKIHFTLPLVSAIFSNEMKSGWKYAIGERLAHYTHSLLIFKHLQHGIVQLILFITPQKAFFTLKTGQNNPEKTFFHPKNRAFLL